MPPNVIRGWLIVGPAEAQTTLPVGKRLDGPQVRHEVPWAGGCWPGAWFLWLPETGGEIATMVCVEIPVG